MRGERMDMREVVANLAREHGMSVSGLELVPAGREVTFGLDGVPLQTVLQLLGDEAGLDAKVDGNAIQFSRKPDNAAVEVVRTPPPVYPADLAKQGVTGRVVLIVDVATDGSVSAVKVDRSAGDAKLDAAALEAARQWKFTPLVKNGKPVPSQVRVPIDFEMDADHDAQKGAATPAKPALRSAAIDWSSYDRMVGSMGAGWLPKRQEDQC